MWQCTIHLLCQGWTEPQLACEKEQKRAFARIEGQVQVGCCKVHRNPFLISIAAQRGLGLGGGLHDSAADWSNIDLKVIGAYEAEIGRAHV